MTYHKNKEVQVLDIVATTIATIRYQQELCDRVLNNTVDVTDYKPTQASYVSYIDELEEVKTLHLFAVSDYVKKTLYTLYLSDAVAVDVTDTDREQAQVAIDAIINHTLMQTLKGKPVNDFIANMVISINKVTVASRDIGLLTYVVRTAKSITEQEERDLQKANYINSRSLGIKGTKVELTATILSKRYLPTWDQVVVDCHDEQGNLITFFKKQDIADDLEIGSSYSVSGRVKSAEASKYALNAIVNNLNYVIIAK